MKIGIIVYSQTGNTSFVANKMLETMKNAGHQVTILPIEAMRDSKNKQLITIQKTYNLDEYEGLVFATFVEGFSLCPVMSMYLKQLASLKDKRIAGFVTEFFPYPWMGGNNAIKQMKAIVQKKENTLYKTGVLNRKNRKYDLMITNLVQDFTNYFTSI